MRWKSTLAKKIKSLHECTHTIVPTSVMRHRSKMIIVKEESFYEVFVIKLKNNIVIHHSPHY